MDQIVRLRMQSAYLNTTGEAPIDFKSGMRSKSPLIVYPTTWFVILSEYIYKMKEIGFEAEIDFEEKMRELVEWGVHRMRRIASRRPTLNLKRRD